MHQTMTTKDNQDRGIKNKINIGNSIPHQEQSGFIESKTGLGIGEGDVPKITC
jgi:hypothetical protein